MRIPYISLLAAGALALSGCAYDMYGSPYGYGYGYGPSTSLSIGIGSGYYGGYGGYGYGYDPFGWYGDYYYPGSGIYVYDSYRRPRVWSSTQQRYWTSRRTNWEHRSGTTWSGSNWSNYSHHHGGRHH